MSDPWGDDPDRTTRRETPEPRFEVGASVLVTILEPGGATPRIAGYVGGVVRSAGAEFDVRIYPGEDMEEVEEILARADVALADLAEGDGFVLRNCQPEQLRHFAR